MQQCIPAKERMPKNLQRRLQTNKAQQVWKNSVLSKVLLAMRYNFSSADCKTEILQSDLQKKKRLQEKETDVYDIEVEGNHNFFANGLLVSNCIWWDETNFTSGDDDLYDAILFTLGTTNGKIVASSTPFNTDSLFWKMCNHKNFATMQDTTFPTRPHLSPTVL